MNKTIGIFAHVDAGKTTFSEQLLYHARAIKQRGRVDHQSAFLDGHKLEKQRGITIYADQATFHYEESTYYLIDTPGHVDFSPEMERSIQILDYAIMIISAVEGVEGHSETVWRLLRNHSIPTFIFINKVDRDGANINKVFQDIQTNLTKDVINFSPWAEEGLLGEELIELLAERDEELLEYFLEQGYNFDLWVNKAQVMIKESKIFPCTYGSALQDIGVQEFLDLFHQLTFTTYDEQGEFRGRVFKIRHDQLGNRLTFIKALSGRLNVRDKLPYGSLENQTIEKVTEIRKYNGDKYEVVHEISPGELFAVSGLSKTRVGNGVGSLYENTMFDMIPTLRSKVVLDKEVNPKEALAFFKLLDAEDPSLQVLWEEKLQQIHIHVMGTIQLEVLQEVVLDRFGLKVSFMKPEIIYKETIESTVIGYGHFEPLKHYAEVHLQLEPALRNSGVHFKSNCHPDDLPVGLQHLVEQHVYEREHHGLLTGSGLTDIEVTLLTGRAHNKHTSGGDFREATFRALRQGLEKAKNVLLEPYYQFRIKIDLDKMGRVITDIQAAHGIFHEPWTDGDKTIITGTVPVATFMDYSTVLASFTKGKGSISLQFAGYGVCHNTRDVIEQINYDKDADPEYTSSSVFCTKGAGFSVKWDEAENMMHCK